MSFCFATVFLVLIRINSFASAAPAGNETFALAGFRDPADTLIECDETWSYRESGGEEFPEVFPDSVDNCLPIDTYQPFFKTDPDVNYDFDPSDNNTLQAVPSGYEILPDRWCSIKQNPDVCGPTANSLYRPDPTNAQGTCSLGETKRGWAFCVRPLAEPGTPAPSAPPTPEPTPNYPLAIGGNVDPSEGPVVCDDNPQYRATVEDVAVDAALDGTFSFDPDDGQLPFIVETNEYYFDYDETLALAVGLPPNSYISGLRWCSIKQTVCGGLSNTIYVRFAEENPSASCPATTGQQRRAWGFAILPGVNTETRTPTTSPIPTPEPTTEAERLPRAVQGFTAVGDDRVGVACDTNWFYRAEQGASLVSADVDGCMSIEDAATQPFRWATPDFAPNASAISVSPGENEVDYTRWCSHKQTTYGTGNAYYTNLTNTVSGTATGPGQLMRAWGYCLKSVATGAPTPYPTAFPTISIGPTTPSTPSPAPTSTSTPTSTPTTTTTNPSVRFIPTVPPTPNLYDIGIYTAAGLIGLVIVAAWASVFTGVTGAPSGARFQPLRTNERFGSQIDEEAIHTALERMF